MSRISSGMATSGSSLTSWRISSIGKSGARSSGPTGCPVPGCSTGWGGLGMSARMLYQRRGICDSSSRNFVCSARDLGCPMVARILPRLARRVASEERAAQHLRVELPRDEAAVAGLGIEAAVLDDDGSAEDRRDGPAAHLPALPRAVVAVVVQVVGRNRPLHARVPENEVRIAAGRDHALARVQAGHARRVRREDLHEPPQREAALADALGEADRAAGLD